MILKFKTNCGWNFLDKIDGLFKDEHVYPLSDEDDFIKFNQQNGFDVGDYVDIPATKKQAAIVLSITRNGLDTKIALPHSAQVFLMNDFGKTIEKLN